MSTCLRLIVLVLIDFSNNEEKGVSITVSASSICSKYGCKILVNKCGSKLNMDQIVAYNLALRRVPVLCLYERKNC